MTTTIKKQLATKQDLAIGLGKVTQTRNGQPVELDLIDGNDLLISSSISDEPVLIKDKVYETLTSKDFGIKGDGLVDDTEAVQAALDSGFNVTFLGNIRITEAVNFNSPNCIYDFQGSFVYDGPETDKLCRIVSNSLTLNNPVFDGNNKQVHGSLVYVEADTKDLVLNQPKIINVKGVLAGIPTVLRNTQVGLLINPNGVTCVLESPLFRNITNDNSGAYDTPTIGYGFCSGLTFANEALETTGDNSANATAVWCYSPIFETIITKRAVGLSEAAATDLNDADAVRVIGNTSDTVIRGLFTNVTVIDVSKRAFKCSTCAGVSVLGLNVYDRTLPYPMVTVIRPSSKGVYTDITGNFPTTRPVVNLMMVEKVLGLVISNVTCDNAKVALTFNPNTNIQNNIYDLTISNVKINRAEQGFIISSVPAFTRNLTFRSISITLDSVGGRGYQQLTGSDGAANARVSELEVTDGDVTLRGLNLQVDEVLVTISNTSYVGYSDSPIVKLGNSLPLSGKTSEYNNVHVKILNCLNSILVNKTSLFEINGNSLNLSNISLQVPTYIDDSTPHLDIYGDDLEATNFSVESHGFTGVARTTESSRISCNNFSRRCGVAGISRPFLVVTQGIDCVFTNVKDYADTSNVALQETGVDPKHNLMVDGVYSKTTGAVAAVVTNGLLENSFKF